MQLVSVRVSWTKLKNHFKKLKRGKEEKGVALKNGKEMMEKSSSNEVNVNGINGRAGIKK